jgi:hypothetical protein
LKPGAFKRYGSTEFNVYSPAVLPSAEGPLPFIIFLICLYSCAHCIGCVGGRIVALQVAFERQTLKPVFHLIGYRLLV